MSFESLIKTVNLSGTCSLSKVEEVVTGLVLAKEDEDDVAVIEKLDELVKLVVSSSSIIGDDDSFHNLAVDFARNKFEQWALEVVKKGLDFFPLSTDLLADYIRYAIDSNDYAGCSEYYDRLLAIPKSQWSWRAFDFSIDYHLFLVKKEQGKGAGSENIATIRSLANDFQRYLPHDERGFFAEAVICREFPQSAEKSREEELSVLTNALMKVGVAPRCALRCAEIYKEQAKYPEAIQALKRCITDSSAQHFSLNLGYVYLLLVLCKFSLFLKEKADYDSSTIETLVLDMYNDCNIGKVLLTAEQQYRDKIRETIRILEISTGIEYSDA